MVIELTKLLRDGYRQEVIENPYQIIVIVVVIIIVIVVVVVLKSKLKLGMKGVALRVVAPILN